MSNALNLVCVLSSFLFAIAAFLTPAAAEEGTALLFRGAETGEVALLQQVLPGADPNLRDGSGRTALMIAAQEGHFDAVRFLLWQGADANLADADGNRAVDYLTPGDNGFAPLNLLLRTYAFVQKEAKVRDRPSRPHLVVINDNFVDYSHPLLQGRYFVNEAERDGIEGQDDDGNGFVDDVYGWGSAADKPLARPLPTLLNGEERQAYMKDLFRRLGLRDRQLPDPDGPLEYRYDNPLVQELGYTSAAAADIDLHDLAFAQMAMLASHGTHVAGIVLERSEQKALLHGVSFEHRRSPRDFVSAQRLEDWIHFETASALARESEDYSDFLAALRARILADALKEGQRSSAYLGSVGAGVVNMSYGQPRSYFMKRAAQIQELYRRLGDAESMQNHACPIGVDLCSDLALELAVAEAARFAVIMQENPDVLFVMSAGNDNENNDSTLPSPCYLSRFFPNAITVASVDSLDEISDFTNYGSRSVQIAAPGEEIESAFLGGGTGTMSGTSQAAPAVAGVSARIRAEYPDLTARDLRRILERSARRVDGLGEWVDTGGVVDREAALELASRWRPGREPLSDWELSRLGREGEDGPVIEPSRHREPGGVIVSGDSLTPRSWRITGQGGFAGNWRFVMSQGSEWVQQAVVPPSENPWATVGELIGKGYEVSHLAGDSGNTSVVMSKAGRPPRRQIRLGYDQTHLQAAMEEGFAITAISGWQDHWDIILTEETAYGRQRFSLPAAFGEERKEWIAGRMAEGYRITHLAGDETGEGKDGSWLVVMTQNSALGDQVYHGVGPWPEDWIEARHGEGYRITATAGYKENWVVVMSRGTNFDEQTVQVSGEFPAGWIATQWGE